MKINPVLTLLIGLLIIVGKSYCQDSLKVFNQVPSDTLKPDSVVLSGDTAIVQNALAQIPAGAEDTTTLSFKNTDIRDIFRGLAYQHGLNIFVDNAIDKRVTISLNQVRVYDAIKFLCAQNNLDLSLKGGIFEITVPPPPKVIPPPKHVPYVAYQSGDLWIDAKNDDLQDVIQGIRDKSGRNILVMGGTSGAITGELNDINFDVGFTQIMNNNGFAVEKRDGIYIVSRLQYYVKGEEGKKSPVNSGPYWVSAKDSLVTIDVTDAPIERVISDLVHQTNSDAIFYNDVPGEITARVTNVSMTEALNLLLMNTKATYRISNGKYFVGDKTDKTLASVQMVKLKYLRPEKVIEMLPQSISSEAAIKPVREDNGIVIMATSDVISQFDAFVRAIDKPVPQVLIEALVVDYNLTKSSQLGVGAGFRNSPDTSSQNYTLIPGINYTGNGYSINADLKRIGTLNIFGTSLGIANLGILPQNFYLSLQALEQKGVADVRSRPLLATLNGYPASLSIGTTQYYELTTTIPYNGQNNTTVFQQSQSFQKIEADVKLEITPYVGENGMIVVDIKPDFESPVGQLSPNIPPTIEHRSLSSTLEMKDGETIVLGGMIQNTTSLTKTATPILGDIPILGALFSSTSKSDNKSELMIYITPHISYGDEFRDASLPDKDKKQ
jgi:type IV pilus assembly protein PilQ